MCITETTAFKALYMFVVAHGVDDADDADVAASAANDDLKLLELPCVWSKIVLVQFSLFKDMYI